MSSGEILVCEYVREWEKSNVIRVEHRVHPLPLQNRERQKMSNQSQPLPLNHIRIINEPNSLYWVYKTVLNSCNNICEFYERVWVYVCVWSSWSLIMIIYYWNKSQEEKSTCLKKIYPNNYFLSSPLQSSATFFRLHNHFSDLRLREMKVSLCAAMFITINALLCEIYLQGNRHAFAMSPPHIPRCSLAKGKT